MKLIVVIIFLETWACSKLLSRLPTVQQKTSWQFSKLGATKASHDRFKDLLTMPSPPEPHSLSLLEPSSFPALLTAPRHILHLL
jgi:hypothetical protein